MVAAFVIPGVLAEALVYDTCQENVFPVLPNSAIPCGISRKDELDGVDAQPAIRGRMLRG